MRRPFPRTATTAYARKTGLHSMSEPRRLKSQQIWSSALRTIDAHPASPSAAATRRSFDAALARQLARVRHHRLVLDARPPHAPREVDEVLRHELERREALLAPLGLVRQRDEVGRRRPARRAPPRALRPTPRGRARRPPATSSASTPSPSAAPPDKDCRRPQQRRVHRDERRAAEPVKPVSHERRLSASSTYSDECASVDGTRLRFRAVRLQQRSPEARELHRRVRRLEFFAQRNARTEAARAVELVGRQAALLAEGNFVHLGDSEAARAKRSFTKSSGAPLITAVNSDREEKSLEIRPA